MSGRSPPTPPGLCVGEGKKRPFFGLFRPSRILFWGAEGHAGPPKKPTPSGPSWASAFSARAALALRRRRLPWMPEGQTVPEGRSGLAEGATCPSTTESRARGASARSTRVGGDGSRPACTDPLRGFGPRSTPPAGSSNDLTATNSELPHSGVTAGSLTLLADCQLSRHDTAKPTRWWSDGPIGQERNRREVGRPQPPAERRPR